MIDSDQIRRRKGRGSQDKFIKKTETVFILCSINYIPLLVKELFESMKIKVE